MEIQTNSYCPGAGLFEIGLERGGLTLQQSFEIDGVCCATQRANWGHEVYQSDITLKLANDEKPSHVKVITYPCNKYSPIAAISGTLTGDELYLHAFRHLVIKPPEVFVL